MLCTVVDNMLHMHPSCSGLQNCQPSDYDFTSPEDKGYWLLCCEDVKMEFKRDLDCEKAQW